MKSTWLIAAAIAAMTLAVPALAQSKRITGESTMGGSGPIKDEMTPEVRERIKKGLAWLAKQQRDDGTFGQNQGYGGTGIIAIAGLAYMADGNMPGEGPYGREVSRVLDHVLKNCQESGLIAGPGDGSPMYGHGFATLFLAEAYGQTQRADLKEKLQNAVRLLVQTQNKEGGWRYQPQPVDADISVTICQIMALRAARNAGVKVPKLTIDRAIDYVKKSQEPDGGFSYTLQSRGSAFPRSAAGLACLYYAGVYEGKEVENAIKYLAKFIPGDRGNMGAGEYHYFYGHYYNTQAMFMAGGDAWAKYWPAIRADMLKRQQNDGGWSGEAGNVYATGMALIILQMPNRLLPILQK